MSAEDILTAASRLADELQADIALCKTREEHIRITARANAAQELVNMLTASNK